MARKNQTNAVTKDEVMEVMAEVEATLVQQANELEGQTVDEMHQKNLEAEAETEATQPPEYWIKMFGNKSNAIRALSAEGHGRSEIAKRLGIRYQHVNNVLKQPLKRVIKAEREAAKANQEAENDSTVVTVTE